MASESGGRFMAEQAIRIDRVIRATIWNHQTVSLVVHDGRLYIIRTGVLAAAATGSVLNEGSMLVAGMLFGGGGDSGRKGLFDKLAEKVAEDAQDKAISAAGNRLERGFTSAADKAARKREALISPDSAAKLATGWMSANLALTEITEAKVSETTTSRVEGAVPQLVLKAGGPAITLRFPQTPKASVEALAALLLGKG